MIAYGAELGPVAPTPCIFQPGLPYKKYFLYVGRMEPENNGLLVRQAFEKTSGDVKLALIGDAPYASEYIAKVRDTKDPRVVIPGSIYGPGYHELGSHCFAYVHATGSAAPTPLSSKPWPAVR